MFLRSISVAAILSGLSSILLVQPSFAQTEGEPVAQAPASLWVMNEETSTITFHGEQTGNKFSGEFGDFTTEIRFDPNNLAGSSIMATISTASAKTGDRQRDTALPGAEWFASDDYPRAVFTAEEIASTGTNTFEARGSLTLRDITHPVTVPFTLAFEGDNAKAEGELTLIRSDFGVGQGAFADGKWVALEVGLSIKIDATKAAE